MSVLAQGTQIYFLHPTFDSLGPAIVAVECATTFSPGGNPMSAKTFPLPRFILSFAVIVSSFFRLPTPGTERGGRVRPRFAVEHNSPRQVHCEHPAIRSLLFSWTPSRK